MLLNSSRWQKSTENKTHLLYGNKEVYTRASLFPGFPKRHPRPSRQRIQRKMRLTMMNGMKWYVGDKLLVLIECDCKFDVYCINHNMLKYRAWSFTQIGLYK